MKLTVTRNTGSYSMFRKIKILLDGEKIGEIGRNETLSFDVDGGLHSVSAKIDWVETNRISLDFSSGDKKVNIGTNFKFKEEAKVKLSWNPFKSISNASKDVGNLCAGKTSKGEAAIYVEEVLE